MNMSLQFKSYGMHMYCRRCRFRFTKVVPRENIIPRLGNLPYGVYLIDRDNGLFVSASGSGKYMKKPEYARCPKCYHTEYIELKMEEVDRRKETRLYRKLEQRRLEEAKKEKELDIFYVSLSNLKHQLYGLQKGSRKCKDCSPQKRCFYHDLAISTREKAIEFLTESRRDTLVVVPKNEMGIQMLQWFLEEEHEKMRRKSGGN